MTARMMKTKSLRIPQKRVDDWMELEPGAARPRARCRAGGRELVGVRRRRGSPRCPARSRPGRPARGAAAGGGATLGGLADRRRARAARRRPCVVRAAAGRDRGRDWVNLGAILGFWGCIRAWAGGETEIGPDWRGSSVGDRIRVKFFDRYKLQWARPDRSELN